jgi:hypothetical protein
MARRHKELWLAIRYTPREHFSSPVHWFLLLVPLSALVAATAAVAVATATAAAFAQPLSAQPHAAHPLSAQPQPYQLLRR